MDAVIRTESLRFLDIIEYPVIEIERMKTTFVCGESGCGKSTLLKLFNATVSSSTGKIFFNGNDIADEDTVQLTKKVILVSQNVFLFDGTIEENFAEYYSYREEEKPTEERIKQCLEICCADFDLNSKCENLSGGERQRIFIAICLSFMPEVIMLDEPTSALDGNTADKFCGQVKDYCRENGITVVVVSHSPELAEKYADNIIWLEKRSLK